MDDVIAYVTAEENMVTVMGGAVAVAAAIIGAASLSGTTSAAPAGFTEEELSGKGLEQAPRIGGRQKKKVKMSKPVLPKKTKEEKKSKARWEEEESSEEEAPAPAPAPVQQVKGKKGKKGKKAAAEAEPEEEAWDVVPKKVKKVKAAAMASTVVGGKTVIDLGESKSAVIGKGGSVIKGIQVRHHAAAAAAGCSLTPALLLAGGIWRQD